METVRSRNGSLYRFEVVEVSTVEIYVKVQWRFFIFWIDILNKRYSMPVDAVHGKDIAKFLKNLALKKSPGRRKLNRWLLDYIQYFKDNP